MRARQADDADEAVRALLAALGAGPDDALAGGPDDGSGDAGAYGLGSGLMAQAGGGAADDGMPLTEGQRQLWFLQQMDPSSTTYNVCVALRMRGPLREPALAAALTALADRHPVLRLTVATRRGRPLGVLTPPGTPVDLRTADAPGAGRDAEIQRVAAEEMATPFDTATGPLMRARLLRFAPDDHTLLLVWHHLVVDGWSVRIVLRDLAALYGERSGGPAAALPRLTHGYGDFATWQHTRMTRTPRYRAALEHWHRTLADAPDRSAPPADPPAPGHGGGGGRSTHFEVPAATVRAVESLAADSGLTPFAVAFTAFLVWLAGAADSPDVVAGVPSSGRVFPQLDSVVGYFVNLMPLRVRLRPQWTFLEAARAVRAAVADGVDHDVVPFDRIVKELGVPRRPGRRPLAQVMFQLLSADEVGGDGTLWHGLRVQECTVGGDDGARFEVELDLLHGPGGTLGGCLTVDAGLHPPGTPERIRDAYVELLADLCRDAGAPLGDRVPGAQAAGPGVAVPGAEAGPEAADRPSVEAAAEGPRPGPDPSPGTSRCPVAGIRPDDTPEQESRR